MAEENNKEAAEEENKVEKSNEAMEIKSDNAEKNDRTGLENLRVLENIDVNLTAFNLKDTMKKKKFRILYGDIRDYNRCLSATKNVDIVIHAAAMKHISIYRGGRSSLLESSSVR